MEYVIFFFVVCAVIALSEARIKALRVNLDAEHRNDIKQREYALYQQIRQKQQSEIRENENEVWQRIHESVSNSHNLALTQQASSLYLQFDAERKRLHAQFDAELTRKLESTRRQTRAVNFGNHAQHAIIPVLGAEKLAMSPKDIRWFGDIADYICFKGLNGGDDNVEIIFVDSKTGSCVDNIISNKHKWNTHKSYNPANRFLNERQKKILNAIQAGRVSYQIWMADEQGSFDIAHYDTATGTCF